MHPALTLFGHGPVPAYELMLALGACALVSVVASGAARGALPRGRAFLWIAGTYLAALLGARGAFAASRLPDWHAARAAFSATGVVGFSSLGALAAGGLAAWWLARRLALAERPLAGPLLLGGCVFGVLARVGCFLAGCCHGEPTTVPWGVVYPSLSPAARLYGPGVTVHPSPLYEAVLLLALAGWLAWTRRQPASMRALAVASVYLCGRMALDLVRGDAARLDGLTLAQWTALGLLVAGAIAAGRAIVRQTREAHPAGGVSSR